MTFESRTGRFPGEREELRGRGERKPTVRQIYALARALCDRCGEEFPESRAGASELIERLRTEGSA